MEIKEKILENNLLRVVVSEKYSEKYFENLQNTKKKLDEVYEKGLILLNFLKQQNKHYCSCQSTMDAYKEFAIGRTESLSERNKSSNYTLDLEKKLKKNEVEVDSVIIEFEHREFEILNLLSEIEVKLEEIFKIDDMILKKKY